MNNLILPCSAHNFELVKQNIKKFELDDRNLLQEEFLTMTRFNKLIGFGRVREFEGFSEMCSTGIIEEERNKGLGARLLNALEKKAKQQVYLVCIIPDYFKRLGFEVCRDYPDGMQEKLNYCTTGLPVKEKYVVMRKCI